MGIRLKPLREQVIVITGASSGIGLCTAQRAAASGARVVLAARNEQALADAVRQITADGGQAVHVVADVGKREDVQKIADTAIQWFGGFDTWVNNAGISIWGKLEEVSDEDHKRLFDTNFWGVVYGSQIAAKHLRQRGGVLINMGSEVSEVAVPIQGMYAASKHAIKGFTDALRMELEADQAPVTVTLIRPAAINTPFTQHAKNYFDRQPKLPPPVYPPEEVANAILYAATHSKRDIFVGGASRMMTAMAHQMPRVMDRLSEKIMTKEQFRDEPAHDRQGALHQPRYGGHVHGDHPGYVTQTSLYTRAVTNPGIAMGATGALLAVAAGAAVALLAGGRESSRRTDL